MWAYGAVKALHRSTLTLALGVGAYLYPWRLSYEEIAPVPTVQEVGRAHSQLDTVDNSYTHSQHRRYLQMSGSISRPGHFIPNEKSLVPTVR